jgi:hypothetical protein
MVILNANGAKGEPERLASQSPAKR